MKLLPLLVAFILTACAPLASHRAPNESTVAAADKDAGRVVGDIATGNPAVTPSAQDTQRSASLENILYRFERAEGLCRKSVSGTERTLAWANAQLCVAMNKSNIGEYDFAERLFDEPMGIIASRGSGSDKIRAQVYYAQHQLNRSRLDAGLSAAREAIRTGEAAMALSDRDRDRERTATTEVARSVQISERNVAQLNQRIGSESDKVFNLRSLPERHRIAVLVAQAHYLAAVTGAYTGDIDPAGHLSEAERHLETVPPDVALWLRSELASVSAREVERRDGPRHAVRLTEKAASLAARYARNQRPEALALMNNGRVLLSAGDRDAGLEAYRDALEILGRGGKGAAFADLLPYLAALRDQPEGDASDSELFYAIQQLRNPVTSETLRSVTARLDARDGDAAKAIRGLQNAELRVNQLSAQLDALAIQRDGTLHMLSVLRNRLAEAEREVGLATAEVEELAPNYTQLSDGSVSLATFRTSLAPDDLFLHIRFGRDYGLVTAVSRDTLRIVSVEAAQIPSLYETIRRSVTQETFGPYPVRAARSLYNTLFGDIDDLIQKAERLIISPDAQLLSMPPGLLLMRDPGDWQPDSGDYSHLAWLGLEKSISIALSPSSHHALSELAPSRAQIPFRGFGDFNPAGTPNAARMLAAREGDPACLGIMMQLAEVPRLDATAYEIARIKALIPGAEMVLAGGFTDSEVKASSLKNVRILHFATHGLLPNDAKCLPEPALTTSFGGEGSDALLEASEIIELELDADLVVLSACETGGRGPLSSLGTGFRGTGGEALSGLVRAFFFAGARSVIASHWEVPDTETADLMAAFYDALSNGQSIDRAMLSAKRRVAREAPKSHPFFWAAFVSVGAVRSDILRPSTSSL